MRIHADEVENEYWLYKNITEVELIDRISNTGDFKVAKPSIKLNGNKMQPFSSTKGVSFVYQINGDGNKDSYWNYYTEPIPLKIRRQSQNYCYTGWIRT